MVILDVNSDDFCEVVNDDLPVLVDFWATDCVYCKMVSPALKDIAKTYNKELFVIKVHGNSNEALVQNLGIIGYPTFSFYKKGIEVDRMVGGTRYDKLKEFVDKNLNGNN